MLAARREAEILFVPQDCGPSTVEDLTRRLGVSVDLPPATAERCRHDGAEVIRA